MLRSLDLENAKLGNFIHVPEPKTDFSPDSLALYEEIRQAQLRVLMKDAKGTNEMYS